MSRAKKHLAILKTSIASRKICDMAGHNEEGEGVDSTAYAVHTEGVAEKAQTLERGGDFPLRTP